MLDNEPDKARWLHNVSQSEIQLQCSKEPSCHRPPIYRAGTFPRVMANKTIIMIIIIIIITLCSLACLHAPPEASASSHKASLSHRLLGLFHNPLTKFLFPFTLVLGWGTPFPDMPPYDILMLILNLTAAVVRRKQSSTNICRASGGCWC